MWWDFSKINSLLGLWFGYLKRKRMAFLFFPLSFCLILAGGVVLLQENNDGRIFFDEASPDRQKLIALEQKFTETNSLLIVLSTEGGDVFAADVRNAIMDVTEQAWLLPYVTRVNSLSNYQRISSKDDDIIIESLFSDDVAISPQEREEIKNMLYPKQI